QDYLALGNETFQAAGARFVRSTALAAIRDANHMDRITAASPREIEALLEQAAHEYAHCDHLRFDVDPRTPPAFEAALRLDDGFEWSESLVMALEDELRGRAQPFEIRAVADEVGWAELGRLHAANWAEGERGADTNVGTAMLASMRRKSPRVRFWLGYADGAARGYVASWEGTQGVGQVESLFVHPDARHRGLATALLHHGVRDCRAHGAGPVALVADAAGTPKRMYTAMGWRALALKREYLGKH
ncbi:MAG TPA: GNAT family N-acetyltransferase, partial [Dehalococcoidia bacterium]|nr:GNAT family N-acetyltransferase [Dehalococcoidia bacterium]